MSGNKTVPVFKIIAIVCLAVVSVVQINIMSDYASDYTNKVELLDLEFFSVIYYVYGFSFLISAFFTLFSLGKRNSAVITTAFEFLILAGIGLLLRENPDVFNDVESKEAYFALIIPVIYAKEATTVLSITAAALLFGILDVTVGSVFTIKSNVNECIYCGRRLRPGEKCSCDLDDTYVINDFETDPANYADDVEKRKCVFCGRLLYGTETCNCPEAKRREAMEGKYNPATPAYTPPSGGASPGYGGGYTPSGRAADAKPYATPRNGAFTANPPLSGSAPSYTPTKKTEDTPKAEKPGDERFFSKPKDL